MRGFPAFGFELTPMETPNATVAHQSESTYVVKVISEARVSLMMYLNSPIVIVIFPFGESIIGIELHSN